MSSSASSAVPSKSGSSPGAHAPKPKNKSYRLDRLTWIFGITTTTLGIALFILDAHAQNLYTAALATTLVGSTFFFLGILSNCCANCLQTIKNDPSSSHKSTKPLSSKPTATPIPLTIRTKDFFESQGIFGLPEDLIEELDIWREYRDKGALDLDFGAGFILWGPPGTGKTTIASKIAELLGGEDIQATPDTLLGQFHGQTEQQIAALFKVPKRQFRVITIDEINGLLSSRAGQVRGGVRVVDHFLTIVSGQFTQQPKYLLIGTTNLPKDLDPAVARCGRLGKMFLIKAPNPTTRSQIFKYHLEKIFGAGSITDTSPWSRKIEELVKMTDNYSCAGIIDFINQAKRRARLAKRQLSPDDFTPPAR